MAMRKLILKEGIDFVETPSEELNCPICLGLLQDPFLTACCGNHFCEPCASKVKQNNNKCPLCQDTPLSGIINKGLKVYCCHKQTGCSWVGDLGKLEIHVAADKIDGECQFVTVKRPVSTQCVARVLRKSLDDHVKNIILWLPQVHVQVLWLPINLCYHHYLSLQWMPPVSSFLP